MIGNKMKGVSVIICSYNGEAVIGKTLDCLGNQKVPLSISWEVILVDNASTDRTSELARKVWNDGQYKTPLKIINQPIPGATASRTKGIEIASYEYILTCDDDNRLSENYIETAYGIMDADPEIGILGGKGIPEFEISPPHWFDQFEQYYACGNQCEHEGDLTNSKSYVYGAGSIYRKSVWESLRKCGFEFVLPGRAGGDKGKMIGGEDKVLGLVHVIAGYKIWYSDQLIFSHYIKKNRLDFEYLNKMSIGNGRASALLDPFVDFAKNQISSGKRLKEIYQTMRHIISFTKQNILQRTKKNDVLSRKVLYSYYKGRLGELCSFKLDYFGNYTSGLNMCRNIEDCDELPLLPDNRIAQKN